MAPFVKCADDFTEARGIGNIGVTDTVNGLAFGWYRHSGIDHLLKTLCFIHLAMHDAHGAELNHARGVGIEAGGLTVEGNRIQ